MSPRAFSLGAHDLGESSYMNRARDFCMCVQGVRVGGDSWKPNQVIRHYAPFQGDKKSSGKLGTQGCFCTSEAAVRLYTPRRQQAQGSREASILSQQKR